MYNKYLGGTKVIKYVINREKYSRRKEARNKIKVWNPQANEGEVTIGHAVLAFIIFVIILKIVF